MRHRVMLIVTIPSRLRPERGRTLFQVMKMKSIRVSFAIGLLCLPVLVKATDSFWINSGTVTVAPQIDATNVVNSPGAILSIGTTQPFQTSNTRNFTNRGTMTGSVGWRLQNSPTGTGVARAAANVHNHPGATISASDLLGSSQLLISATNIINEGLMAADMQGKMVLNGTNINLKRGGIQISPLTGVGTLETIPPVSFRPDVGIIDDYWGVGTNAIDSSAILSRFVIANVTNWLALSPLHNVQTVFFGNLAQVQAFPAIPFVNITNSPPITLVLTNSTGQPTNFSLVTNIVIEAAFIGVSGSNIAAQARFYPSTQRSNVFNSIAVELAATVTNSVTLQEDKIALYLVDRSAAETNVAFSTNLSVYPRTLRPGAFLASRLQPIQYLLGDAPNATLTNANLLYDPSFTNRFVSAFWSGYGFTADRVAAQQPSIEGGSITNIPGRIEVNAASTLNMERTRVRSDGLVTIRTPHLISSTNANMDAFNLRLELGSTNGTLRVQNLAKSTVDRFGGEVTAWTAVWSNTQTLVITNNFTPSTNPPPAFIPAPLTNIINYTFHVLIVDASLVSLPTPVTTLDFVAKATNVFLADPLTITNRFFTDAQQFTLEGPGGQIALSLGTPKWTIDNTPNLRNFTNAGTITVASEAWFGADLVRATPPLNAFVNRSNLTAQGITISSSYFENAGLLDSASTLAINTVSGRFENSQALLSGDLLVQANDFKFRNSTNQLVGAMSFYITNSLFDNGSAFPNYFVCGDGFHVNYRNATGKPTVGDLLGTTFETAAPIFASVQHTWPGEDRGLTTAGYTNNLALGRLVLSVGLDAEIVLSGAGVGNAMYVDYLQFNGVDISEVETALLIDANLIVYFADSNLPAEQLDGLFSGRLRWVKSYAGAYSGVDLLVNGQVIKVNRALRQSTTLDSDGDGLANGFDASPFDPAVLSLTVVSAAPLTFALDWTAAAQTVYKVEFTTNNAQSWQTLKHYTNTTMNAGSARVLDLIPAGGSQRYYRVGYQP